MKGYNFDSLKFATEGLSGGACTVIQDDVNLPSFMVAVNQRTNAQLFEGGSQKTHSAFMVDDVEYKRFFISKFLNCVVNGRAYSWPLMDPKAVIDYDASMQACNAKGNGWHLMSIPERAVIDHLLYKSGFIPRGNTQYGQSHTNTYETGEQTADESDGSGGRRTIRTAAGSGPATWFHDGTRDGIADWVGNVWKWASSMRIVNGEIQIFVGNLAARQVSAAAASTFWKAILPTGALVNPGTAGTLKFTNTLTIGTDRVAAETPNKAFASLTAETGVTIPEILKELHIFPVGGVTTYQGQVYVNTDGERLPVVGGCYHSTSFAGASALRLGYPRSFAVDFIGFFSAFLELQSVI